VGIQGSDELEGSPNGTTQTQHRRRFGLHIGTSYFDNILGRCTLEWIAILSTKRTRLDLHLRLQLYSFLSVLLIGLESQSSWVRGVRIEQRFANRLAFSSTFLMLVLFELLWRK
jgi:hypothetical protein